MLLAAAQSPLLDEKKYASVLIPRLCNTILMAPNSSRHVSRLKDLWYLFHLPGP